MLILILTLLIHQYEQIDTDPLEICIDDYEYLLFDSFGIIKLDAEGYKVECSH